MNIAVLGAGNWGTIIALLLNSKGYKVRLWEFNETLARDMINNRENKTYLKGYPIPEDIFLTSSLNESIDGANIVVFVVPSSVMRGTALSLNECRILPGDAVLVSLSKGLEYETLKTMTDVIADEVAGHPVVALSGPCIASEVAKGMPTTIVSASKDQNAVHTIQNIFMTPKFRVYTSDDPLGVQFGGSFPLCHGS